MADQTGASWASHLLPYFYSLTAITTIYLTFTTIYNLYFHPLRSIPGPLTHRASSLPYVFDLLSGTASFHAHDLHEKYGPVVRLSPNHLSFGDVRAWRDIYGHRIPSTAHSFSSTPYAHHLDENPKSPTFYGFFPDVPPSILEAPRGEHALYRKALSNGFSEKALRAQEGRIKRYVDFLTLRLKQNAKGDKEPLDIAKWYNWTAFDVTGDLVFAEPFGCLERQQYHPFVELILGTIKGNTLLVALNYLDMGWVMRAVWELGVKKLLRSLLGSIRAMLVSRMEEKVELDDLFEGLMKHKEEWGISLNQLQSNAMFLIAAGSETTSTLLAGVTYLLLSNPEAMAKLKIEVRNAFNSADEITIASASRLPYMLACLNEALRMYPPVTGGMVREVAPGGTTIAGHVIPGGTMVECKPWVMNHSSSYWNDPWTFRPQRFLQEKATLAKVDAGEAFQPFSTGPRNCIGRNLAYAEMRLILANIVYNFDLDLAKESQGWAEKQRAYPLWERGPLKIFVESVSG